MIKIKHIVLWCASTAAIAAITGFGSTYEQKVLWQENAVVFKDTDGQLFITENEVLSLIENHYPQLDSLPIREINTALLEESLDNHPSIEKAEVYSTLKGYLRIDVWQHRPLARVNMPGRSYYLLNQGATMPLSPNYSARVPLLTGAISDSTLQPLSLFWKKIEADPFYNDFFTGLHVSENGNWILYPKPGHHQVHMGSAENWENKLERLKIFYQTVANKKNIDSIKAINLKFNHQVICRK